MKKIILLGLIGIICLLLILIAVGRIRPFLGGRYVRITYPPDGTVVPTEFTVLAVAAKWSPGIEINTPLFLGTTDRHAKVRPVPAEITLDGSRYDRRSSGDHHVFRISAPPGDHTVGLTTPEGTDKITVRVIDSPPVAFTPFDVDKHVVSVDALKTALCGYNSPVFSLPGDKIPRPTTRIFLVGDGAFVLCGSTNNEKTIMTVGEVRYVSPLDGSTTADDIAAAPVVFMWDSADSERPVRVTGLADGVDRLYMPVFDDTTLTVFSVFPDGRVDRRDFPLSTIAPTLAESIRETPYPGIIIRIDRDLLAIRLSVKGGKFFSIAIRDGVLVISDNIEKDTAGPTTPENPLTRGPASFDGPEGAAVIPEIEPAGYQPLPTDYAPFSFTAFRLHSATDSYQEKPRFEVGPAIPSYADCHGNGGDVIFKEHILRSSIGGYEEYFSITPSGQ